MSDIPSPEQKEYISSRDAAKLCRVTNDHIARLCRQGKLRGVLQQRNWLVEKQSLLEFFTSRGFLQNESASNGAMQVHYLSSKNADAQVASSSASAPERTVGWNNARWAVGAALTSLVLMVGAYSISFVLIPQMGGDRNSAAVSLAASKEFLAHSWEQLLSFFSKKDPAAVPLVVVPSQSKKLVVTIAPTTAPAAAPSTAPTTRAATTPNQTIIQNTYPVVERTSERITTVSGISENLLDAKLSILENALRQLIYANASQPNSLPATGGTFNNLALTQRIDALSNVRLTNVTVSGISGITVGDLPSGVVAGNYLPLTGGTLSGTLVGAEYSFQNGTTTSATSTNFAVSNLVASATSTLRGLTLSNLDCSQFSNGGRLTTDASGNVVCGNATAGGAGTPGGNDTQVQFNDGGNFAGDSGLTYSKTADRITVVNASTTALSTSYASSTSLFASNATSTSFFASLFGLGSDYISDITGAGLMNSGGSLAIDSAYNFFSTTSADFYKSVGNFFSTTSATYWSTLGLGFSTTSEDYYRSVNNFYSTTSADYWKSLSNFFSTTSTTFFSNAGLAFSTTSEDYYKSVNNFFSTTSANYWSSLGLAFSTTSNNYWSTLGLGFSTTSASNFFRNGLAFSTTTNNTFTGNNMFLASTTIGAGGQTTGLTISGGATTTGTAYFAGNVGIGTNQPAANLHVSGNFRVSDATTPTTYFQVINTGPGGSFPRTQFQGGNSSSDVNWQMRFANAYSNSALNIPIGIQLSTNNDASYTNANVLMMLMNDTRALMLTVTAAGSDGKPILFSTNGGDTTNPKTGIMLDTVANNQRVGIGTSTPFAGLSVHSFSDNTNRTLFAIASSTSNSTTTLFSVSNTGAVTFASGNASVDASGNLTVVSCTGCGGGSSFSTTSANYWSSVGLGFSTTSASNFFRNGLAFSTTTNNTFTGNNMFLASTTIGAGGQTTGLTISGGATTTGTAYFGGSVGMGVAASADIKLQVLGTGTGYSNVADFSQASGDTSINIASGNGNRAWLTLDSSGNQTYSIVNEGSGSSRQLGFHMDGNPNHNADMAFTYDGNAYFANLIGIGTTTPSTDLSVQGDGLISGSLNVASLVATSTIGIGTSTPGTSLSIGNTGANTINISATATSTFGSGINVLTGCFAVNGTCLGTSAADIQFSTTSANYWSTLGLAFSTTSEDYYKSVNNFFSTTSSDYYASLGLSFSTTSASNFFRNGLAFSTTTNNTFTGNNMFLASTTIGAGGQTTGLTISGGATTTGTAYFVGNVGIGTSSPSTALDVTVSNTSAVPTNVTNIAGGIEIFNVNDGAVFSGLKFRTRTTSPAQALIGLEYVSNFNDGALFFRVRDSSTTNKEVLRLLASGNVGFSTSTPSKTLSVQGDGLISGTLTAGNVIATSTIGIGTSTPGTSLSIGNTGANTINIQAAATSTFGSGINVLTGCFSVAGVCVSALSFSTTSANYWSTLGLAFSTTSASNYFINGLAFSTTTTNTFTGNNMFLASTTIGAGATSTGLTISGGATTTGPAYFGNKIALGTTTFSSNLSIYNPTSLSGTALNTPLSNNAINLASLYGAGSVTLPGLVWTTADNNATIPKAGIWTEVGNSGAILHLGAASDFTSGPSYQNEVTITKNGGVNLLTSDSTAYVPSVFTNTSGFYQFVRNSSGTSNNYGNIGFQVTSDNTGHNSYGVLNMIQPSNPSNRGDFAFQLSNAAGVTGEVMRLTGTGRTGIGTSTPFATLSVHASPNMGLASTTLFAIASSTSNSTTTLFAVDNTGSTTAANGFNITAGCYAVSGNCLQIFSTTSANYWSTLGLSFSTTSASNFFRNGLAFSTTTTNTWTGANMFLASTTIGNGTQAAGLTISGGATTTGSMYSAGRIQTNGGMLFNQGSAGADNFIYAGSASAGAVDASFGFFVAGVGSTVASQGSYFTARGNNFSALSNQRGNMYFVAGNPTTPGSAEGSLNFLTGSEVSRMIVTNTGTVGIGSTTPAKTLSVQGDALFSGSLNLASLTATSTITALGGGLLTASTTIGAGGQTTGLTISGGATTTGNADFVGDVKIEGIKSLLLNNNGALSYRTSYSQNNGADTVTLFTGGSEYLTLLTSGASPITMFTNNTERMRVDSTGNVGVGTTTPYAQLSVNTPYLSTGATKTLFAIASSTSNSTTTLFSISNTGLATFTGTGGTCTINGSGACTSDERLKKNIVTISGTDALAKLSLIRGVTYNWIDPNLDQSERLGVIAQDVLKAFPDLVGSAPVSLNGTSGEYYTVNYAGLTAPLISAVNELNLDLLAIASTSASSTPASQSFASNFFAGLFGRITQWLADATNGIHDIYATVFHAHEVHTDSLCVNKTDGVEVCVTGDQLAAMLAGQTSGGASSQGSSAAGTSATSTQTTGPDTQGPLITINGNNPAVIQKNDTYSDLGATVTDNVDQNLKLTASVDGGAEIDLSAVQLDTSSGGAHTIIYKAVDQAGNIGIATRTVNIVGVTASTTINATASTTSATATSTTP